MSRGFLDYLKRERDIFIKPTLSGEKMAFMCTPALSYFQNVKFPSTRGRRYIDQNVRGGGGDGMGDVEGSI